MLGARDEDARERSLEVYKEEKRKVKRCIYQSKEEIQEQFGGRVENSNKIKDGNRRLVLEETEV